MPYSEARKQSTYRYREKNYEFVKLKQSEYAKKSYQKHRHLVIGRVTLKREFQRLSKMYSAYT